MTTDAPTQTVCGHGQLARSCELCEADRQIASISAELAQTNLLLQHERDEHHVSLEGIEHLKAELEQERKAREEAERLVYVPGVLKCAKCKLVLVSTFLDAKTGNMAANSSPQQCPNGCGPMWRRTERDAGNDLCDRLESSEAKLAASEAREAALREDACRYRWLKSSAECAFSVSAKTPFPRTHPEQDDAEMTQWFKGPALNLDAAIDAAREGKEADRAE